MKSNRFNGTQLLKGSVSLMALAAVTIAGHAQAQAAASTDKSDEVVVVGVRKALKTAQDIKKNADTQVDSITATDIGAFPDKSVAEALQRVPGITVSRFQSSDDSTHFSAEPAQVLIRGLTFVRTELNGRDIFTADGARGLNFNDVSPELMAGVDSYKNLTADMIEGGIAGSVNLRTRLPFDSKGQVIALSGRADYGDRSKKATYEYSGMYSNRWQTSVGEFGLLVNYANSHVLTQTEAVVMQRIGTFCDAGYADSSGNPIVNSDGSVPCTHNPYGGNGWAYIPDQVNYSQVEYDRTRHGTSLAAQYQNNDKTFEATLQYNDTYYRNAWRERSSNVSLFGLWAAPAFSPQTTAIVGPADGSSFTFAPDGTLTSGIITTGSGGWGGSTADNLNRGSVVAGLPFVNYCGAGAVPACTTQRQGITVNDEARIFNHTEGTKDISLNAKWKISDQLRTNFDVQYVKAQTNNYDILVAASTLANADYSVNGDGTPQIKLEPGSNVNYAPGFLSNTHNWFIPYIQDHYEDNDATQATLRADAEYRFHDAGWLDTLKVGVRYADRKQKVRYSAYNWSPVVQPWNGCNNPGFSLDNTTGGAYTCNPTAPAFKGYGAGIWAVEPLRSGFYNGDVYNNGPMVFLSNDVLGDYQRQVQALSGSTTGSPLGWTPLCQRASNTEGCFVDSEMLNVSEKTEAAYAMLKFGGPDKTIFGGITVNGNIGVRYVTTDIESRGGVAFNNPTWYTLLAPCSTPTSSANLVNPSCYLTADMQTFSQGAGTKSTYGATHNNWLPSFNIRFGLDDKNFIRFGASRALSRPDFGQLRNYVQIQAPTINTTSNSPFIIWKNPAGSHTDPNNVQGYNFVFNADSGNAALAPITADQFDLSYENYISSTSSFTFDLFYKHLNGDISYAELPRAVTFNGVTENVVVRGPGNGKGGGTLRGFEAAYQTFFDFLPSPFNGLGIQANYTRTEQSGITNSNLANEPGYAAGGTIAFGGGLQVNGAVFDSHRLAGISDESYNIVLLYEKGPIAGRIAYSYRSDFLTNNLDCCIGLPMWQKGNGFLDASLRYRLSDNVELSIDGSNLLNTTTVMQQQVMGDSSVTPGAKPVRIDSAWIRNDRRFQMGVRFKY
ncbi:TonB-dependent receptor [Asticcacaulis solisilvae]|uniref:TonB-dependent receptor n=1 Tax=Asticcacaulis solisilvae TaxID=1217274 RepID=UPI003FD8629C